MRYSQSGIEYRAQIAAQQASFKAGTAGPPKRPSDKTGKAAR